MVVDARFHLFLRDGLDAPVSLPVCGGEAVVHTLPSPDETDRINEDGALVAPLDE